ncbi:protein tfg-1-like [Euwallacea fornicatus]|uniref:protein tfg-1-like n=1 Tax=Euwallacea fornicatus TaxID=995702 RepID=UPI003390447B
MSVTFPVCARIMKTVFLVVILGASALCEVPPPRSYLRPNFRPSLEIDLHGRPRQSLDVQLPPKFTIEQLIRLTEKLQSSRFQAQKIQVNLEQASSYLPPQPEAPGQLQPPSSSQSPNLWTQNPQSQYSPPTQQRPSQGLSDKLQWGSDQSFRPQNQYLLPSQSQTFRPQNQGFRPQNQLVPSSQNQAYRPQSQQNQNQGFRPQNQFVSSDQSQGLRPQNQYVPPTQSQGFKPENQYPPSNQNQGFGPQSQYVPPADNQVSRPQNVPSAQNRPQATYGVPNPGTSQLRPPSTTYGVPEGSGIETFGEQQQLPYNKPSNGFNRLNAPLSTGGEGYESAATTQRTPLATSTTPRAVIAGTTSGPSFELDGQQEEGESDEASPNIAISNAVAGEGTFFYLQQPDGRLQRVVLQKTRDANGKPEEYVANYYFQNIQALPNVVYSPLIALGNYEQQQ